MLGISRDSSRVSFQNFPSFLPTFHSSDFFSNPLKIFFRNFSRDFYTKSFLLQSYFFDLSDLPGILSEIPLWIFLEIPPCFFRAFSCDSSWNPSRYFSKIIFQKIFRIRSFRGILRRILWESPNIFGYSEQISSEISGFISGGLPVNLWSDSCSKFAETNR